MDNGQIAALALAGWLAAGILAAVLLRIFTPQDGWDGWPQVVGLGPLSLMVVIFMGLCAWILPLLDRLR